jgi:transposase
MTVAGIDVAKDKLDVVITGLKAFKVAYGEAGLVRLVARLKEQGVSLVVMEASGGYERGAEKALRHAGIPVAVVNPTWIRNFARSYGHLEKTDIIDASVLERYARERTPEPTPPLPDEQLRLKALVRRRDQLKQEVVREVNRRKHPFIESIEAESIDRMCETLKREIKTLEAAIATLLAHESVDAKARRLTSVPGVGVITAAILIAELPELGALEDKQIAKLAGLAPLPRDSGKATGQRSIRAGRELPRRSLFMAAFNGVRNNPVLKTYYAAMKARGKHTQVALVAAAHKLLTILNAMERKQQHWQTPPAQEPLPI